MNPQNKWRYILLPRAKKQFEKLSPRDQARVFRSIQELVQSENPLAIRGVKYLQGSSNPKQWRQRQGDYRIIFSVEAGEIVEMNLTYKGRLIIHEIAIHHTGY
jgi:mRNA-degrading endonuclease RelE of RelBE toxin-antitoxin system